VFWPPYLSGSFSSGKASLSKIAVQNKSLYYSI